jgi:hypothetical protein
MTNDWKKFRKHYSIEGHTKIIISYYGENVFKFSIGPKITCTTQIKAYHSRSTIVGETIYFDHTIYNKNKLVSNIIF